MRTALLLSLAMILSAVGSALSADGNVNNRPRSRAEPLPEDYSCTFCHADPQTFYDDTKNLLVTEEQLADDVHWQKGIRCHDCHGGNPVLMEYTNHRDDEGFRSMESPAEIPTFCGRCHSDIQYMRRFDPSARTDQEAEYWTSGHGQALKNSGDPKVANCVSCHGRHGILTVDDQQSPVYPTRVAETCAGCHSDDQLMAGRTYHDRPLGHDQYASWRRSVHGKAMMDNNDVSAPTCNDCHGNHGAVPPGVASVANACGACHGRVAELFDETLMKHRFEEEDVNLPGCATCHGSLDNQDHPNAHDIQSPTEQMLGMAGEAVCVRCHQEGAENLYGASPLGADTAMAMREGLERLSREIEEARAKVEEAQRLGMEVSGPLFNLRAAFDARTNARSLVHSFSQDRVDEALAEGFLVTENVKNEAEGALDDYTERRVWLGVSLVPIIIVIILLLLYIRTLPNPAR